MKFKYAAVAYLTLFVLSLAVPCLAAEHDPLLSRPRLYFNSSRLQELRLVQRQTPYVGFLKKIRKKGTGQAKKLLGRSVDQFNANTIRRPADGLANLAFYHLITKDHTSLDMARSLLKTFTRAKNWGGNKDIGAAHVLFATSLAYDWLYPELPPSLRQDLKKAIAGHARIFYTHLIKKDIWWAQPRGLMQNHNYVNAAALAVAGVALYGQNPEAGKWLNAARDNFNRVLPLLSPDGASHEGVAYWSYGTLWLLNYYLAQAHGPDRVKSSPFFRNTAKFRLYASVPGFRYNVNYADSPDVDFQGPGAVLRCLAGIFKDSTTQWLANKIDAARKNPSVTWQDYAWYDPGVKPIGPDHLPTHAWFDNLGILLSRSSWAGNASLVLFKAGPPQGFMALNQGIFPGSHIHPDAGGFALWLGEKALVPDDGYAPKKLTAGHNTLVFDNKGQLGQGGRWFKGAEFKKGKGGIPNPVFKKGPGFQAVEAELAGFYPAKMRPKSWKRAVAVIGGTDIFIRDKVLADKKIDVQSLVHLNGRTRQKGRETSLGPENGYTLAVAGDAEKITLAPYSITARNMGKRETRSGKLLSTFNTAPPGFSTLTAIARPKPGGQTKIIQDFDQAKDQAVVQVRSGGYRINFSTLAVEKLK